VLSVTRTFRTSSRFSAWTSFHPRTRGRVARPQNSRFLSQPFTVATVFSGLEGKQVPVAETVRGFKEILDGKHDAIAEGDFYMKGGIDEIKASPAETKSK